MKITKRQLRRIIKEEKRKLLREGLTQEENLYMAIQDYVIALQDQMDFDSVQDFLPDALGFVKGWFENQAIAEENDEDRTYWIAQHNEEEQLQIIIMNELQNNFWFKLPS